MENIQLPKVEYVVGDNEHTASVVVEPLFPGYGTTIGNALRRILLSSLQGAAVTAVKIHNTPHEFTTIPKVKEDVLEIILNLKKLRLKVFRDEPVKLHLKVRGEKKVTAKDIDKDSEVEIANPDLLLATLTGRDAELEMDITVQHGRGFVPTEAREKQRGDIGTIAVDALFSPVRRVSFHTEGARVGQMTNFDKLTLEVETDGTITVRDAITAATSILMEHFALFANVGPEPEVKEAYVSGGKSDDSVEEPRKKRSSKKKIEAQ